MASEQNFQSKICQVCGGFALGFYYGRLACESCRIFFRRTVLSKKQYYCWQNSNCQVNTSNRKKCIACRLAKCIKVGMNMKLVTECKATTSQACSSQITLPPQEIIFEPKMKRPITGSQSLTAYENQCIAKINLSMNTAFVNESTLPLGTLSSTDDGINIPAIYTYRIIHYLKRVPFVKALPVEQQLNILHRMAYYFKPIRFAFQYDPIQNGYIFLKDNTSTEAVFVSRELVCSVIPDQDGLEANLTVMMAANREMGKDETTRNLLSAISAAKAYTENDPKAEYLRYYYAVNCYLLQRYLQAKYKNEELANASYNRLMYQLHNQLPQTGVNYAKWIKLYLHQQANAVLIEGSEWLARNLKNNNI